MPSRSEKKAKKNREQQYWYALRPVSMLLPLAYLAALFLIPVVRGESLTGPIMTEAVFTCSITLFSALLLAWIVWRMTKRSNFAANGIFALVVIAAGVWTIGLSGPQRVEAETMVRTAVGERVTMVKEKAAEALE